jgi:hypothetical protein
MNDRQDKELRDAVFGFALALDAFIVNGATICVTPWESARDFVEQKLYLSSQQSLRNLQQCAHLTDAECDVFWRNLESIKEALLSLANHSATTKDQRELSIQKLRAFYAQSQDEIKRLEARLRQAPGYYDTRPGATSQRIAELMAQLPQLLEQAIVNPTASMPQAMPAQPTSIR